MDKEFKEGKKIVRKRKAWRNKREEHCDIKKWNDWREMEYEDWQEMEYEDWQEMDSKRMEERRREQLREYKDWLQYCWCDRFDAVYGEFVNLENIEENELNVQLFTDRGEVKDQKKSFDFCGTIITFEWIRTEIFQDDFQLTKLMFEYVGNPHQFFMKDKMNYCREYSFSPQQEKFSLGKSLFWGIRTIQHFKKISPGRWETVPKDHLTWAIFQKDNDIFLLQRLGFQRLANDSICRMSNDYRIIKFNALEFMGKLMVPFLGNSIKSFHKNLYEQLLSKYGNFKNFEHEYISVYDDSSRTLSPYRNLRLLILSRQNLSVFN